MINPLNKGKPKTFGNNKKDESKKPKKMSMVKKILIPLLTIFVICVALDVYNLNYYNNTRVEYSDFEKELKARNIDVVFLSTTRDIKYVLKGETSSVDISPEDRVKAAKKQRERFQTDYPDYEDFRKDLLDNGAVLEFESADSYVSKFLSLTPTLIMLFWIVLIFKMFSTQMRLGGGFKGATTTTDKDIKFESIIGLDEIIDDIRFTMKILTSPELCDDYKVKPPKGILLSGPPGTGKTMIAKAIANELKVEMISVDSSSLIEIFAGTGAARIREIFKQAKEKAPCVVFFDELDAIGGKRHSGGSSVDNEYKQVIDALLQELDGFSSGTGILVIGATNLESHLDTALTRSGRFSKKIIINPPKDSDTRKKLFENYLKDLDLKHVDLESLSKQSTGLTGADIADICNEAKMIAVAREAKCLTTDILEEALDKMIFKGNRTKNQKKRDIEITAYHESGHAVSMLINNMPISRITIIPNTSGVGGMVVNSDNESSYYTKEYIRNRIKTAYAGRIAEELIFGKNKITTGASSDIEVATGLIRNYLEKFGFDEEVGLLDITTMMKEGYINNQTTVTKIHELSRELYNEAKTELEDNLDILERFAKYVMENETITGDKAAELFRQYQSERETNE